MNSEGMLLQSVFDELTGLGKSIVFGYRLKRDLWASKGEIVIVYQMAKVGSTSVYRSMRRQLKIPVYHTHFLSLAGIQGAKRFFVDSGAPVPPNLRYSGILRKHLSEMRPVLITLVRDPIAREISNYFQIGARVFEALRTNGEVDVGSVVSEVSSRIRKLADEASGHIVHTWFDREIKSVFKVDVYEQPFNFQNGYVVVSGEKCKVLLFRLEDLDRSFKDGVREALGERHGTCQLQSANTGSDKAYADLYREVKARIHVDPKLCRAIYTTRFGKHFYADMAEELTRNWSKELR